MQIFDIVWTSKNASLCCEIRCKVSIKEFQLRQKFKSIAKSTGLFHICDNKLPLQAQAQLRDCQVGPDYKIIEHSEHRGEIFDKNKAVAYWDHKCKFFIPATTYSNEFVRMKWVALHPCFTQFSICHSMCHKAKNLPSWPGLRECNTAPNTWKLLKVWALKFKHPCCSLLVPTRVMQQASLFKNDRVETYHVPWLLNAAQHILTSSQALLQACDCSWLATSSALLPWNLTNEGWSIAFPNLANLSSKDASRPLLWSRMCFRNFLQGTIPPVLSTDKCCWPISFTAIVCSKATRAICWDNSRSIASKFPNALSLDLWKLSPA